MFNLISLALAITTTTAVNFEIGVYDLEDEFKNIPDLIGIEDVRFNFKLTNWFLDGF
tara:strand:+ start:86 stop:256 length:171 start_codon:yes stop_codon:yes gene_type:complete